MENYIVSAKQNLLVTDSLKEVYRFLKDLQKRGITYVKLIGTDLAFRLTDNGFWVWTEAKDPKPCEPTSTKQIKSCSI